MAFWLTKRLLNFLMSGWPFENNKKDNSHPEDKEGSIYEAKLDYVSKITGFLEDWVREIKKDIKKL